MTQRLLRLSQVLFLVLIAWSGILLYKQAAEAGNTFSIDVYWLSAAIIIKCITVWLSALKFRELIRLCGINITGKEWFGLSVLPTFHSYLSPAQTGHILRAVYLKKFHDFQYQRYTLTVVSITFLETCIAALFGIIVIIWLPGHRETLATFFSLVLVLLILGPFLIMALTKIRYPGDFLKARKIDERMLHVLKIAKNKPAVYLNITGLCIISLLGRWCGLYLSFRACGFDVAYFHTLIMECARTISSIITITPSNIGISEGVIAGTGTLLGVPINQSVPAAVVSRLIAMVLYITLGLWYTKKFFGKLLPEADK